MVPDIAFFLPGELPAENLLHALGEACHLGPRRSFTARTTYLDTFDERLAAAGWTLAAREEGEALELALCPRGPGMARRLRVGALPAFPRELPDGALRETLLPVVELRRLLPRVIVGREGWVAAILDRPRSGARPKVLGRLTVEERFSLPPGGRRPRSLPSRLVLLPATGYQARCEPPVREVAARLGLGEAGEELPEALAALGPSRAGRPPRAAVDLRPGERADRALRRVLRGLLAVMLANEAGARAALDVEFLHDFRVALRRLRSVLTQVPGIFPGEELERYRRELSWLGRVTGPKRDHDVLLATFDGYLEGLPEWVREGLQGLRTFLLAQEEHEQEELVAALDSERYRRLVAGLKLLVRGAGAPSPAPGAGRRPISQVAAERLGRAARRVRKRAAAITAESPAARVHRLRIEAKKYRYLLEVFRSLFPAGKLAAEIKSLKKLQDVLGTYNDLATQRASLLRHARKLGDRAQQGGEVPADSPMAVGFLIARLEERQRGVRAQLEGALKKYLKARGRRRERQLFSPGEAPP